MNECDGELKHEAESKDEEVRSREEKECNNVMPLICCVEAWALVCSTRW